MAPLATRFKSVQSGLGRDRRKIPIYGVRHRLARLRTSRDRDCVYWTLKGSGLEQMIIEWGMIVCVGVPLPALIMGPIRGIPFG